MTRTHAGSVEQRHAYADAGVARASFVVRGVVQGVGFRPFVHALAVRAALGGFVRNTADGVHIEVEGRAEAVAWFARELASAAPARARIHAIERAPVPVRGERDFSVSASVAGDGAPFVPADVATCDRCLAELFDPRDRRFRHPFIACTDCGPRFTVTRGAPWDRARTSYADLDACDACRRERETPDDRRFHAQTLACPGCGPRLTLAGDAGHAVGDDAIARAVELLRDGAIVAVKGLGGWHLACDAGSAAAVANLRRRKRRDEKPFAVLVADVETASTLGDVGPREAELLRSAARPIVLLRVRADGPIARAAAPRLGWIGVTLPAHPVQHLLARDLARALVMTSGNRSGEPIAIDDDDARVRLDGVADAFLGHDRAIEARCDDSVLAVAAAAPVPLRRARGFAPEPIALPFTCARPILALGGHGKCAFALGRDAWALVGPHVGDLDDADAVAALRVALDRFAALFRTTPDVWAHDLHPGYATTALARELAPKGARVVAVQHHHAHVASCMAERGLVGPVLGVAFDGTGHGLDGTPWGGELLVTTYRNARRVAHLRPVALPGGDAAAREPWRSALAHVLDAGEPVARLALREPSAEAQRVVSQMITRAIASPKATSAGRLFDAVAAMLGVRERAAYEAEAAMELQALAAASDAEGEYPYELVDEDGRWVIDTRPLVRAILAARERDDVRTIARRFHRTLAAIIESVAVRLRDSTGITDVVLTGGVFANVVLLDDAVARLERARFRVHTHALVPPNDGGLCLGQLAVAAAAIAEDR